MLRSRTGAQDRRTGEQFALETAQLLTDARDRRSGEVALSLVAGRSLPPDLRASLLNEIDNQIAAGTQRHLDTAYSVWFRSEAVGDPEAPTRLNVEIAAVLVSDPLTIRSWHRDRYDVAREGGRWSLVSYGGGRFGPDGTAELTPAEQHDFLPGKGWRRIPPS